MSEHRHTWTPCMVRLPNGTQAGKRCHCGVQTVGGLNVNVVATGQRFNSAIAQALINLASAIKDTKESK